MAKAMRPAGNHDTVPIRKLRHEAAMKCMPVLLVFVLGTATGQVPSPAPAIHDLDWRSSPLDLNLRGLNGERFRFRCPPGKATAGQVVGSGPYADGSSICAAAVHAGVLHAASGGLVTIEIRPGASDFVGSLGHFVQSRSYAGFWSGSFVVVAVPASGASSWTPGSMRPG